MQFNKKIDTPVLIVAYSRPEGISYLLRILETVGVTRVYIAIDGPKNLKDKNIQESIKIEIDKYINKSSIKIRVMTQSENLGVANGVISAIDWFFSCEELGIILEDDLRISEDFYQYAAQALEKYRIDPNVWMISGTQLFPAELNAQKCAWTNYPMIWGWAGWSKKWDEMRQSLLKTKHIGLKHLIDRRYIYWAIGANRALDGKVDTWDTPLAFEFFIRKKLCLLPPVNLVSNIGNDEVSSHTKNFNETLHLNTHSIDAKYSLPNMPDEKDLSDYNKVLEDNIFRIRNKHIFLSYYSYLLDFIKFPKSKRKSPLNARIG